MQTLNQNHSLPKLLKQWRERNRFNQDEGAQRLGVPVRTLRAWEQGTRQPTEITLRAILQIIVQ